MCIALFFYFDIRKVNPEFQIEFLFSRLIGKGKLNKAIVSHQAQSTFFSEDLTEEHEVSRPNSTELKSWDKYTLSFILRFQFKIFTRNERH